METRQPSIETPAAIRELTFASLKAPLRPARGKVGLPVGPGLGIELDEAALEDQRVGG